MKTILLTGGTGFLGRHLIPRLLDLNQYELIVAKRKTTEFWKYQNFLEKAQFFNIDEIDWKEQLLNREIDIIFHMATNYGKKQESLNEMAKSNLFLPIELIDFANKKKIKNFVNIDTSLPKDLSAYAFSKKQFLDWLRVFGKKIKITNIILENFYGPRDGHFISSIIDQLKDNVEKIDLTLGNQRRDFIYYQDVINGFVKILDHLDEFDDGFNQFEIGSGQSYQIKEVVSIISSYMGNSKTHLNWGALNFRENEVMDGHANITSLLGLGWAPKFSLLEGLKKVLQEYEEIAAK